MKTKRLFAKTDFARERRKEAMENLMISVAGALLAIAVFIGGLK